MTPIVCALLAFAVSLFRPRVSLQLAPLLVISIHINIFQ
jgi:hypothetical protein